MDLTLLREINLTSVLVRLLLSALCSGIIGLERGTKRQAAGFRTHILVCTGACMATMTGQYIHQFIAPNGDPARLGAQVISGIGFLGAGTIITTNSNKVRGLTTAAGLWSAACIGLAIGIGFYEAALAGTFVVLMAIVVLHKIDEVFYARVPVISLYVEMENISLVRNLLVNIREHRMKVSSMELQKAKSGRHDAIGIALTVTKIDRHDRVDMIEVISCTEGLTFIEELV